MRTFISLLCALCLFLSPIFSCAETLYVCTDGDDLNGRERPDKHSPIMMKIPNGDTVEALSTKDGWVEVVGGESNTSWCKAEYLSSVQEAVSFRNTSGGRVFVRECIEGAKTGVIRANKAITVTRQIFGWG